MERKLKNESKGKDSHKDSKDNESSQIDDVIGDFGKYQFLIFLFKIFIGVTSAFNNLGVTFFAPSDFVSYWCADVTSTLNLNYGLTNSSSIHEPAFLGSDSLMKNATWVSERGSEIGVGSSIDHLQILSNFASNEERKLRHESQLDYDTPKQIRKECTYLSPSDNQHHKCTSFNYNTGIWISTIIDQWDLVCDRAWFISLTQSLYMSGFIVAYLVFGYISDRFGRWRSLLLGALMEIGGGFGCAFASSVTCFMAFRFLVGIGGAARSSSSYLIMIEWCGPKWRMHVSGLGSLGWVVGYCAMPWLSIYFLHFRHMQLFVCFYESVLLIWFLTLPESPRWLLTHKRFNEAYDVLLMAARFNGLIKEESTCCSDKNADNNSVNMGNSTDNISTMDRHPSAFKMVSMQNKSGLNRKSANKDLELPVTENSPDKRDTLEPFTIAEYDVKFKRLVNTICAKEFTNNEGRLSIIDLFKWKNLRRYTLILAFAWAANSFIYYGIALRAGDFGGRNLFINFTVAGITELPSIVFTIVCLKFLPRRTTNLLLFITVGLLCVAHTLFKYYDQQWLQQTAIILAKLFNSCSFVCILYQTMELFPTSIRQNAYSSCSLAGRIGSILAPFIKELSKMTNEFVPPVIFAILSLIEALLVTRLPETKGSDLTDTLLEAEKFEGTDKKTSDSK